MDDGPKGDEVECEVEPSDWKVTVATRNNATQKEGEGEAHEATHTHFSDAGAHTA